MPCKNVWFLKKNAKKSSYFASHCKYDNNYRIDGYRTPAFYSFVVISGFSKWSLFQCFEQKCNNFEINVAKNDHCVSKMTIVCQKWVSWHSNQDRHSISTIVWKMKYVNKILLCSPVLNPQIVGILWFPPARFCTSKVSWHTESTSTDPVPANIEKDTKSSRKKQIPNEKYVTLCFLYFF